MIIQWKIELENKKEELKKKEEELFHREEKLKQEKKAFENEKKPGQINPSFEPEGLGLKVTKVNYFPVGCNTFFDDVWLS